MQNIFSVSAVGPLRNPGLARDYIIIESVGREGLVNTSDPTTLSAPTPVQFQGFTAADQGLLNNTVALMKKGETAFPFTQVNRAFASIGIIETARFVTNKYNGTRAADFGIPAELGVMYNSLTQGKPVRVFGASATALPTRWAAERLHPDRASCTHPQRSHGRLRLP